MSTTALKMTCPYCEANLDRASGQEGTEPRSGDVTICIQCLKPSRFDDKLEMQKFNLSELDPFSRIQLKALIRSMRATDERLKRHKAN